MQELLRAIDACAMGACGEPPTSNVRTARPAQVSDSGDEAERTERHRARRQSQVQPGRCVGLPGARAARPCSAPCRTRAGWRNLWTVFARRLGEVIARPLGAAVTGTALPAQVLAARGQLEHALAPVGPLLTRTERHARRRVEGARAVDAGGRRAWVTLLTGNSVNYTAMVLVQARSVARFSRYSEHFTL
eukprot:6070202-Prymnesium_polylepis.1